MEIHELVVEMKLLERRLTLYEEKYGNLVLSGGAHASRVLVSASRRNPSCGLNDVSGAAPDTAGETPALPFIIMHGLWGMGQMLFTKSIVMVDGAASTRRHIGCPVSSIPKQTVRTRPPILDP
jgi:hypothetical protein